MVRPAAVRLTFNFQLKNSVKNSLSIISCTFLLSAWAVADLPRKMPISNYSSLWNNSPFTSKPPPPPPGEEINPLDDYALIGVSPIGQGYRVTLINKKQPTERIMVDTGDTRSGFEILGITRKSGNPLGTEVRMRSGSKTGTVSYDEQLLTIAAPVAAPPQNPQIVPGQPPGVDANGQPVPQRQPRPRVVPPPATPAVPQAARPAAPQERQRRRN